MSSFRFSPLEALRRFFVVTLLCLCASAALADNNLESCAGPGPNGPEALVSALNNEKSCQAALKKLGECQWGSSADTEFSAAVVSKCESDFLGKLSASARKNYADRMQLCAYKYARIQGTMYISAASYCQADEAAKVAADPTLADKPVGPASFDCDKAQTPIEKTICANPELGKADIVLAEQYRRTMNDLEKRQKPILVSAEKTWLDRVVRKCKPEGTKSKQSAACIRNAFEIRFSNLITCGESDALSIDCLDDESNVEEGTEENEARASFDCDNPSTPMEIAICADAALGQTDIKLAAAYKQALAASNDIRHAVILASQRKWLDFVRGKCPLGAVGGIPPVIGRACIQSAYEIRIVQLADCPAQPAARSEICLNTFKLLPDKPRPDTSKN